MIYILLLFVFISTSDSHHDLIPADDVKKREIVLIYIGTYSCPVCGDNANTTYFDTIQKKLINENSEFELRTIGIALDQSPKMGYDFLFNLSDDFDEMIVGGNKNNVGALRYLQGNFKGIDFIPQLLIMVREYKQVSINNIPTNISLRKEVLAYRIVGLDKIKSFASVVDDIDFNRFFEDIN